MEEAGANTLEVETVPTPIVTLDEDTRDNLEKSANMKLA